MESPKTVKPSKVYCSGDPKVQCYILPVEMLAAERAGDFEKATSILYERKGLGRIVTGRKRNAKA